MDREMMMRESKARDDAEVTRLLMKRIFGIAVPVAVLLLIEAPKLLNHAGLIFAGIALIIGVPVLIAYKINPKKAIERLR